MRNVVATGLTVVVTSVFLFLGMAQPAGAPALLAQEPAPAAKSSPRTTLTVPDEVRGAVGGFVVVRGETDGKGITFRGITPGLNVFPAELLADKKATVVTASASGTYTLLAAACGADGIVQFAETRIVINGGANGGPPKKDPPTKDPPVTPAKGLYFIVVRPDGPADPSLTAYMGNAGWKELMDRGHFVKEKTVKEAAALGIVIPDGTVLPTIVTLKVRPDGSRSDVVRGPVPLPAPENIVKLPEGL